MIVANTEGFGMKGAKVRAQSLYTTRDAGIIDMKGRKDPLLVKRKQGARKVFQFSLF